MKAIVVDAPLSYGLREVPRPQPPAGWSLVRVLGRGVLRHGPRDAVRRHQGRLSADPRP